MSALAVLRGPATSTPDWLSLFLFFRCEAPPCCGMQANAEECPTLLDTWEGTPMLVLVNGGDLAAGGETSVLDTVGETTELTVGERTTVLTEAHAKDLAGIDKTDPAAGV